MIPKFRAFVKKENKLFETDDLLLIDFLNEEVMLQQNSIIYATSFDFDEVVLMQSTGLHDKNGKEIFEGDIIKMVKDVYSDPTYYEVIRHLGGAYRLESNQHGCELWLRHTNCEVIGNIYENPDLLEV